MPISWDETVPSDSDRFSGFAAQWRSLKSSFALGVSPSLIWPGSGGGSAASAGFTNPGVARAMYDLQSNYSAPSSVSSGNAFIASDTSRFFGGGSSLTQFLGGARITEHAVHSGNPAIGFAYSSDQTQVVDATGALGSSDGTTVHIFYTGTPFVSGPTAIDIGVYANTSIGTGTLTGLTYSIVTSSTTRILVQLQALSRTTSFPTGVSVSTVHVFAVSSGTVAL